jgi:phenylalanyl-tRNA synthetase beta chain
MREICGLFVEYGFKDFEEIVDIYPNKQAPKKLSFSRAKISKILGIDVKDSEIENILKRYNFVFTNKEGNFEISVPLMRLDLNIGEDMAEEVGRVLGYDKLKIEIPKINFTPKVNDTYAKVSFARNKLLTDGYSEVMTYAFANKGEVEVLESASDKKFLRSNISDGLKEAIKLNQNNLPVLGVKEVKIFEIGTVFKKGVEVINVAFGDKKSVKEMSLEEYITENSSSKEHGYFSAEKFLVLAPSRSQVSLQENSPSPQLFVMWPLFPFIARDVAVWVPEDVSSEKVASVIRGNMGSMVVRGPELFDEFKKEGKVSYAFRIVFQSYDKTLTDMEVNQVMENINKKLLENSNWQVR